MTVSERIIYIGVIFLLFTLPSSNLFIGTGVFALILCSAFLFTFLIRDLAELFDYSFSGFFSVFTVVTVIYAILARFGSENIAQPSIIIGIILILSGIIHVSFCSQVSSIDPLDISDIINDEEDETETEESAEEQAEQYTGGDDESDSDTSSEGDSDDTDQSAQNSEN